MKTIIAGSRDGVTFKDVLTAVRDCGWQITSVVSGTARGADKFGEKVAKLMSLPIHYFPADWNPIEGGPRDHFAARRRNVQMAENAEALIAVWDGRSPGTKHMINVANMRGLKVYVHTVKRKINEA